MDSMRAAHIYRGVNPIRIAGRSDDLEGDPQLWAELWERHRARLLPEWIREHPGSRPPAWHTFDAMATGSSWDEEVETEVEYLHRLDLMEPQELAAIRDKAKDLARFNSAYARGDPRGHFIEPDAVVMFAAAQPGWLTAMEREHLGLEPDPQPRKVENGKASDHSNGNRLRPDDQAGAETEARFD
jgi:hypothetical protein